LSSSLPPISDTSSQVVFGLPIVRTPVFAICANGEPSINCISIRSDMLSITSLLTICMTLTYLIFLTYLYFWWAWPKGACRMQTDRSTDRQTKARTYAKNWRTDCADRQTKCRSYTNYSIMVNGANRGQSIANLYQTRMGLDARWR